MTQASRKKPVKTSEQLAEIVAALGLSSSMNRRELAQAVYYSAYVHDFSAKDFVELVWLLNPSGNDKSGMEIRTSDKCYPDYKNQFKHADGSRTKAEAAKTRFLESFNNADESTKQQILAQLARDNFDLLLSKIDLTKYIETTPEPETINQEPAKKPKKSKTKTV